MDKLFKPWTTLSPVPPKFQSCYLFPSVETDGQNKSNPAAWHVTHTLFNFDIWGTGCQSNLFLEVWICCPSTVCTLKLFRIHINLGCLSSLLSKAFFRNPSLFDVKMTSDQMLLLFFYHPRWCNIVWSCWSSPEFRFYSPAFSVFQIWIPTKSY